MGYETGQMATEAKIAQRNLSDLRYGILHIAKTC
jgi:hypothetical protein